MLANKYGRKVSVHFESVKIIPEKSLGLIKCTIGFQTPNTKANLVKFKKKRVFCDFGPLIFYKSFKPE